MVKIVYRISVDVLWNAVQDKPKSLLVRIIREDVFDIPQVYGIILAYALLIVVLNVVFACATHRILGPVVFYLTGFVMFGMQVRHWMDIFKRLRRISALGHEMEDRNVQSTATGRPSNTHSVQTDDESDRTSY